MATGSWFHLVYRIRQAPYSEHHGEYGRKTRAAILPTRQNML